MQDLAIAAVVPSAGLVEQLIAVRVVLALYALATGSNVWPRAIISTLR